MKCIYCDMPNDDKNLRCLRCGRRLISLENRKKGDSNDDVDDLTAKQIHYLDSWLMAKITQNERLMFLHASFINIIQSKRVIAIALLVMLIILLAFIATQYPEIIIRKGTFGLGRPTFR